MDAKDWECTPYFIGVGLSFAVVGGDISWGDLVALGLIIPVVRIVIRLMAELMPYRGGE